MDELEESNEKGLSLGVFTIELDSNGMISYHFYIDEEKVFEDIENSAKYLAAVTHHLSKTNFGVSIIEYLNNFVNSSKHSQIAHFRLALVEALDDQRKREAVVVPASKVFQQ